MEVHDTMEMGFLMDMDGVKKLEIDSSDNKINNLESDIIYSSDLIPFVMDDDNFKMFSKINSKQQKQQKHITIEVSPFCFCCFFNFFFF
jgi:hypothetical protein